MVTVGFGDIHPVNQIEKLYVIIITILSSGLFGYTISVIGSIMHSKSLKESEH